MPVILYTRIEGGNNAVYQLLKLRVVLHSAVLEFTVINKDKVTCNFSEG
jgi:hypothetical protein